MGVAAAKQCCEQYICPNNQNKVVPIKTENSNIVDNLSNAMPTLGAVIDYGGQALQPLQRVAWNTAKSSLPQILSQRSGNEASETEILSEMDDIPPPVVPKTAWTTGDQETGGINSEVVTDVTETESEIVSKVVSDTTPSAPYLLNPTSGTDDKPPVSLP